MKETIPDPPSLLTLSPSLLRKFRTLSGGDVRTFKQVFIALWRWLWPISRLNDLVLAYSIPSSLAQVNPSITLFEFFLVCKLYLLSGGGSQAVNTVNYTFSPGERQHLKRLKHLHLITRTSFDPLHPHLVRPSHINRTYISLTPSAITMYKAVMREVHRTSHNDLYLLSLGQKRKRSTDTPIDPLN